MILISICPFNAVWLENVFSLVRYSIVSYARRGQTALAPKAKSWAICIESRISPLSTIMLHKWHKLFSNKYCCKAETASKEGIGAEYRPAFLSERIKSVAPPKRAFLASCKNWLRPFSRRYPALSLSSSKLYGSISEISKSMSRKAGLTASFSEYCNLTISSFRKIGWERRSKA